VRAACRGREFSFSYQLAREKCRRLTRERLVILEERAVAGIGIHQKRRVREVLREPIGVAHRNHVVVYTVNHESWLTNTFQIGEARARELLPVTKGVDLRRGYFGS